MSSQVVVFPDVAAAVANYLRDELDTRGFTVTVGTVVPKVRPDMLVRVLRTGGARDGDPGIPTELAQVTVESWANSEQDAHDLSQVARALVHALRGQVEGALFYGCNEISGPAHLPDPISDQPRFTFTVQLIVRGEAEAGS